MSTNEIQSELYKAGEFIFFEGDEGCDFYIVQSGEVEIFTKSKAGLRIDIMTVKEGESFGEFALLEKTPRTATARALTDCSVVRVSEEGYLQLLTELPVWAQSMLHSFAHRIKIMNERFRDLPQFIAVPKK